MRGFSIWNILKLLVAVYIIKTCVIDNDLVIGLEDGIRNQVNSIFHKKGEQK